MAAKNYIMSKQKRGMFRRMIDAGRKALGGKVTHYYPDPVIRVPLDTFRHGSSKRGKTREVRKCLRQPPCVPGTITFHDKLVCYYGRRKADQIGRDIQHRDAMGNLDRMDRIPTDANFAAMKPWAWLK